MKTQAWKLAHGAAGVLLLGALLSLPGVRISNDVLEWLPEHESEVRAYREQGQRDGFEFPVLFVLPLRNAPDAPAEARFLDGIDENLQALSEVGDVRRLPVAQDGDPRDVLLEVVIRTRGDVAAAQTRVLDEVLRIDEEARDGGWTRAEPRIAGTPVTNRALNDVVLERGAPYIALSYLVLMGLLTIFLRREGVKGIVLGFGVLSAGSLSTFGAMGLLGIDVNLMTIAVPSLVMILSIVDVVHIVKRLRSDPEAGVMSVFAPCFWTTLTTAVGFASLGFVDLPILSGFGSAAAVGVALTLFWSFYLYGVFAPHVFKASHTATADARPSGLPPFTRRLRSAALPGMALAGVFLYGATWVQVDTNPLDYLPRDGRAYQDLIAIERDYVSSYRLDVELIRPDDGKLSDREWRLKRMAALREMQAEFDDVLVAPAKADKHERISIGLSADTAASGIREAIRGIESRKYAGLRAEVGGFLSLFALLIENLLRTQIQSGLLALGLIAAIFALIFRRPLFILAALACNMVPVALTFALLGWTGIKLDITTVCVAAIALGLIVDDTVHLMHVLTRHGDDPERVRETVSAISWTTLIIVAGFAVMAFAPVLTIRLFGMLLAFAAAVAYVFDLLVLGLLLPFRQNVARDGSPAELLEATR